MALRRIAPTLFRKPDDDAAFERLYERHVEGVYRYSLAMLGDAADAEDVTQTTFLNAYRAIKSGTRPEKPSSWLIAIAHNVCRQRFRQAQRRPREVAFDEGIGEAEVAEPAGPTADELRRALSELPPNQRAALVMRELEGSSYAEIADVLGVSVSALETLLFRARRSLREQLDEQLTCDEASLAINRQLDGRLSLGERRALRAHLRACAECNSLAQSQRAQRRALKSLVLVPLPLTIAHWTGAKSASAATTAGGLTAAGATTGGTASLVLGGAGVAAKVAAVVVAGVVVSGGTYEAITHASPGDNSVKAAATAAPTKAHGLSAASVRKLAAPQLTSPVRRLTMPSAAGPAWTTMPPGHEKQRASASHPSVWGHGKPLHPDDDVQSGGHGSQAAHDPPGQTVSEVAHTDPHALQESPPGQTVSAERSSSAGSQGSTHTEAPSHSQAAPSQAPTNSKAPAHSGSAGNSQARSGSAPAATTTPSETNSQAPAHSKRDADKKAPPDKQTTTTETAPTTTTTTPTETTESRSNSGHTPQPGGNASQGNAEATPPPDGTQGNSGSTPRGNP